MKRGAQILRDCRDLAPAATHAARAARTALHHSLTGRTYAAKHLEPQFTAKSDPWDLERSVAGVERFEQTWRLVPKRPYRRITEQIVECFPDAEVVAGDVVRVTDAMVCGDCCMATLLNTRVW